MKSDYCAYPPQLADDVEITEQRDGARTAFIVGAASADRYLLLRATEQRVLSLLDGTRTGAGVCHEFSQQTGASLSLPTLTRFLAKLDDYGILAGERTRGVTAADSPLSQLHYLRFKLFNPDQLFTRLLPKLRWIWTTGFFVGSASLMAVATLLALMNAAAVVAYGEAMLREHFMAIFLAAWLIGITHEFAHGMTCKAFGGRATEVGVLMVYYFLPALYCNVSGIHLIPTRGRRLWVIAAGVYWQLMIGAISLLAWFVLAPHTLPADLVFIFLLGSVLDVFFNANPLIKLDGYYFLSQWLRLPNLMDRSRAYWRSVLKRMLFGERNVEAARYDRRERLIYLVFGLLSFAYNVAFATLIVLYVGGWLMDRFYLLGFGLALGVGLLFVRRPLGQLLAALKAVFQPRRQTKRQSREGKMADHNQINTQAAAQAGDKTSLPPRWRRRLVPLALALLFVTLLLMPWRASVGNYGVLVAVPDREAIIRAPEAATLVQLNVKPGDQLAQGTVLGRLGNLDVEEQITAVQTDLARVQADYDRLLGELRVHGEAALRTEIARQQRQRDFAELEAEQRQINAHSASQPSGFRFITISNTAADAPRTTYPAALAALQAEAEAQRALLKEAATQRDRLRALHGQGLIPRSELDAQEARAATLAGAFDAARQRLDAALIEHRRHHASAGTELRLAESDTGAKRMNLEKLNGELRGQRALLTTLATRRDLLLRKRAQFDLATPRAGWVFGEELPRLTGQFFAKGAEICRIADTRQLLLRIQVPEREIADVRVGLPVRLKVRAFPAQTFTGTVSKLGSESERDEQQQPVWRVELTIENQAGQDGLLLRPGMTAFARVDYGRQPLGQMLAHKIRQGLRPELWLF
jgi:putative peptide zinc metalloprotease protein